MIYLKYSYNFGQVIYSQKYNFEAKLKVKRFFHAFQKIVELKNNINDTMDLVYKLCKNMKKALARKQGNYDYVENLV